MSLQKTNVVLSALVCVLVGGLIGAVLLTGRNGGNGPAFDEAAEARPKTLTVNTEIAEPGTSYSVRRVYTGVTRSKRTVDLGFSRAGRISGVFADKGERVEEGALLAELDTSRLEIQRSQLENALSASSPPGNSGVSETDLKMVEADLEDSILTAPFDAVVAEQRMSVGSMASPGAAVFRLSQIDELEAWIAVPVEVAEAMGREDSHELEIGGETHRAEVTTVLPEVDLTTRTRTIVLTLDDNSSSRHLPGQSARLELEREIESDRPGFWIPLTALTRQTRGLWALYAIERDDDGAATVSRNFVELVHVEGDRAWVRGTPEGELEFVSDGTSRVVPGQKVKIKGDPDESDKPEKVDVANPVEVSTEEEPTPETAEEAPEPEARSSEEVDEPATADETTDSSTEETGEATSDEETVQEDAP
ncbi:MAG: HlyD family efflux transporter periplasmic adaptor subunit [Verrucomicrobiales bacterium]